MDPSLLACSSLYPLSKYVCPVPTEQTTTRVDAVLGMNEIRVVSINTLNEEWTLKIQLDPPRRQGLVENTSMFLLLGSL